MTNALQSIDKSILFFFKGGEFGLQGENLTWEKLGKTFSRIDKMNLSEGSGVNQRFPFRNLLHILKGFFFVFWENRELECVKVNRILVEMICIDWKLTMETLKANFVIFGSLPIKHCGIMVVSFKVIFYPWMLCRLISLQSSWKSIVKLELAISSLLKNLKSWSQWRRLASVPFLVNRRF